MSAIRSIINLMGVAGNDLYPVLQDLDPEDRNRLATVLLRPDLGVRYNRSTETISIRTSYGNINLDSTDLKHIRNVYVNGQAYSVLSTLDGMDALEHLTGSYGEVMLALDEPMGQRSVGRRVRRSRQQMPNDIPLEDIQTTAYNDLSRAGLTYTNIFQELDGVVQNLSLDVRDIVTELYSKNVDEKDIAHFLIYDSTYKKEIMSRMYNYNLPTDTPEYHYELVTRHDDTFIGRLVDALGHEEAQYDREQGVLTLQENGHERSITNLPVVDDNGIFHNGDVAYLPYYIGYFAEGPGDRVDRLRVIDPVEEALNGVRLQYALTGRGDVKFKTILDVTRNLPDFENHPYGAEILDTLKHKVVLSPRYHESNSLLAEYNGNADELGAVAMTMMDKSAKGIIDPYGTSNGRNLGMIFYLAQDAVINEDGSLTAGENPYSAVGEILNQYHPDRDNFNRNQMSFNAFLTSLDVKKQNVFISEFALWNMEDGIVLTNDLNGTVKVGDKMEDFHGNKSTISVILSELSEDEIKERHLEHAVQFAKDNPNVDIITSPSSLASRLNMGILYEGLEGERSNVSLPNGDVVKNGSTQLMYMRLPQTAEHKSKDYSIEGGGRRYSTLFRYALTAKVGDLYKEGLISDEVHRQHVDEAVSTFERLGVSFKDEAALIKPDNVNLFVDAPVTVHMDEFHHITPAAIRMSLMSQMDGGNKINIDLGDIELPSRLYDGPIQDSEGRNILPIRVPENGTIPYRYMNLFTQISRGNAGGIEAAYKEFSNIDYGALTVKDNILKNIDTMTFTDDARTTVIVPDPSLGLNEVRSNVEDDRVICHRDPAIQCGNVLSMYNVGGAAPNVLHLNPLMENMQDADNDGDTEGENAYKNLTLSDADKDLFFEKSNVTDRVNYYGEVHLGTNSSYFKALAKVNDIDLSDITFADGKTSEEIVALVEEKTRQILDSPNSYGAYAIDFTDIQTAKNSLCRMADDGLKGKREDIERYIDQGYTPEENTAIAKALIAKSEWTGLAGATTNKLISSLDENHYHLLRSALDITHSMTQSTLQMKKNADKLPQIDTGIKEMKRVMDGRYSIEDSRSVLKSITAGLLPETAVDTFVDQMAAAQDPTKKFGYGIINNTDTTTMRLSYASAKSFEKAIQTLGDPNQQKSTIAPQNPGSDDTDPHKSGPGAPSAPPRMRSSSHPLALKPRRVDPLESALKDLDAYSSGLGV